MTTLLAIILILMTFALVWVMFHDHARGYCELLSCRNLGLLGLILFQLTSGAYSLWTGDNSHYMLYNPAWAGTQFVAGAVTFTILALWAYRRGWIAVKLAHWLPTTTARPSDTALLINAALITGLAAGLRFGVAIPLVAIVAGTVGVGLAAVSAGLVGWVWGKRLLNPAVMFYSVLIVAADMLIVLATTFGRRGLVAVGAAIVWGMYYSYWRHLRTSGILSRAAIISLPPIIFLALFTSVRSSAEHDRTAGEQLQNIAEGGSVVMGVMSMLNGQYAGSISMFLIENYPETYEYRHLQSIYYFFILPVPRAWWPGKPIPLSQEIARQARIARVDWNRLKLGPGIVGHAAAEGGIYALLIYAIVAGLFFRFFDEFIQINIDSPFVVLAVGSALGQFLGIARGSVPNFAFIGVLTIAGSLFVMIVLGKIVERISPTAALPAEEYDEDETDWEYDDYPQSHAS